MKNWEKITDKKWFRHGVTKKGGTAVWEVTKGHGE